MNPWIRITRPVNGIMGIAATIISAYIGTGSLFLSFYMEIAAACACVFMVTSGGNVINDITDVETDRKNHPDRPIPTGMISLDAARNYSIALFAIPLALSAIFLPIDALIVVALAEGVLISYEFMTKKLGLSGNVSISILVGLIFLFGGIAVGSFERMLILFGMASLANLSRELIKEVEDIEGDVDRNTFPKKYGRGMTTVLAGFSVIAAVSLSALPYLLGIFTWFYLIPVAISDALFLSTIGMVSARPAMGQQVSKLAMIIGLVSFVVGAV